MKPIALFIILLAGSAFAEVPTSLHHQGRIAAGGVNFDGTGQFKFLLYHGTAPGTVSAPLWKNDDPAPTNDTEPATAIAATVTKGLYTIHLGESPQAALPANIAPPTGQNLYLRIWFDDGSHGSQLLAPDQGIAAVPFTLSAASVADGSITAASLEPSLTIPNVRSGLAQTVVASPWISSPLTYSVTFPTPFAAPPIVTVSPTVDSRAPVSNVTVTGFSGTVEVPPGTWSSAIDASGFAPCLAEIDGRPAVAYEDISPPRLKFAINTNSDGSGAWVYSNAVLGENPNFWSLANIGGKPAIAYTAGSTSTGILKLLINSTADGSGSWTTSVIDPSPGSAIQYESLAEIDGRPAIAYYDSANENLKFAINSLADGSGAWTSTTVDSTGSVGDEAALATVDGRPAIAYQDESNNRMNFAINSLADATGSWTITVVDSNRVFRYPSIDILSGQPAISYQSSYTLSGETYTDQKFATNTTADGSGSWSKSTVGPSAAPFTQPSSLAIVDGLPIISFVAPSPFELQFAIDPGGTGSGPWDVITIDPKGFAPSLASIGGQPMIASSLSGDPKLWRPQPVAINWIAVGQ